MPENKTKPTRASVTKFLAKVDPARRKDCQAILQMMKKATGVQPKMWGPSMVGFGKYHYQYASGREGDCFVTGFSPRKDALSLYLTCGFEAHAGLMKKLGKYKTGKSCLYIKKLDDVDCKVLEQLVKDAVAKPSLPGRRTE